MRDSIFEEILEMLNKEKEKTLKEILVKLANSQLKAARLIKDLNDRVNELEERATWPTLGDLIKEKAAALEESDSVQDATEEYILSDKLKQVVEETIREYMPHPTREEAQAFEYNMKEDELVRNIRLHTLEELVEHPDFVVFNDLSSGSGTGKIGRATVKEMMWGIWREDV